jgi:CheY-like chemotaxis protein
MPNVLLVADAPWVINEVRAALALGDWHLEELANPRVAADTVEERQPEAVIVDMQVGSMGGMATVRAIRQETDPSTRPRIVLLLDRSADDFIAKRAGADARVLKPITASALRSALSPEPAAVSAAGSGEEE